MKTVRKNILLLWKAMKERLSEIRKKPQRRKEKSWQNSAKERKSLSLKPDNETRTPEEIILETLGKIEFNFGGENHTVEEAKLLFTYEIGLDL